MSADELDGKDVSGPDSFYKVYEPVFERNKRFAVILPAPSLGDDDTPIDEVRKEAQARVFTSYARRVSKLRWAFPWPCLVLSVACVVASRRPGVIKAMDDGRNGRSHFNPHTRRNCCGGRMFPRLPKPNQGQHQKVSSLPRLAKSVR